MTFALSGGGADAFGSTVSVKVQETPLTCEGDDCELGRRATTLSVDGEGAEPNDLLVEPGSDGFLVRDRAVPLHPGEGCRAVDPNTVACAADRSTRECDHSYPLPDRSCVVVTVFVRVAGGDGDDTLEATLGARLIGGGGNDTLRGSETADELYGGPGNDNLTGGPGDDALSGDGEDPGIGGVLGNDTLDGGPGRDIASWEERAGAVIVDLADPQADGAAGETDVLLGIEDVRGGRGDNVLRGDDGPNHLGGSPDGDGGGVAEGRGGDDVLDHVGDANGGDGDDQVSVPGYSDATCGSGRDSVDISSERVLLRSRSLPRDCEALVLGQGLAVERRARLRGRRLSLTFLGWDAYIRDEVQPSLRVKAAPGRARSVRRAGEESGGVQRAVVRLKRRQASALRKRRRPVVRVSAPFVLDHTVEIAVR